MEQLAISYIGNFEPEHSTENEVRKALEALGHRVTLVQENNLEAWDRLGHAAQEQPQLVLWTRTGWDWERLTGMEPERVRDLQSRRIASFKGEGIPVVGFHLDRWWGLDREGQLFDEPFFRLCDLMATADGGHQEEFAGAGIEHVWMPPAVSEFECEPAEPSARYRSDIAFVGSWRGYHREWKHRGQLVRWLQRSYGRRCQMWPKANQPAVRGLALRQLYASIKIAVGDSCLVPNPDGSPAINYWSDRIPETLGRGGFLLHPWVKGLDEHYALDEHLVTWELGDWDQLRARIGYYSAHPDQAREIAAAGRAHVLEHHTYTVRMRQLIEAVRERLGLG